MRSQVALLFLFTLCTFAFAAKDEATSKNLGVLFQETGEGVVIKSLFLNGIGYSAGLRAGDRIVEVNDEEPSDLASVVGAIDESLQNMVIEREGLLLNIELGKHEPAEDADERRFLSEANLTDYALRVIAGKSANVVPTNVVPTNVVPSNVVPTEPVPTTVVPSVSQAGTGPYDQVVAQTYAQPTVTIQPVVQSIPATTYVPQSSPPLVYPSYPQPSVVTTRPSAVRPTTPARPTISFLAPRNVPQRNASNATQRRPRRSRRAGRQRR